MNRHMGMLLGLAAIVLVAMTGTATATPLVVNDANFANVGDTIPATDIPVDFGSFDNQGQWNSPNDYWANDPFTSNNWAQLFPFDTSNDAVAWRPSAAAFPGAPANGLHVMASDYDNLVATGGSPSTSEVELSQNLSVDNPVLGTIQPGLTYTLTIAVGAPIGKAFTGIDFGFGDTTAQTAPGLVHFDAVAGAGDGNLVDVTCTFSADDAISQGLATAGDSLAAFMYLNSSGVECYTVVTNVRVDVTPEPSSLVLLAAGAVSLLAYAWKKRK